jgi:hypothetical protein
MSRRIEPDWTKMQTVGWFSSGSTSQPSPRHLPPNGVGVRDLGEGPAGEAEGAEAPSRAHQLERRPTNVPAHAVELDISVAPACRLEVRANEVDAQQERARVGLVAEAVVGHRQEQVLAREVVQRGEAPDGLGRPGRGGRIGVRYAGERRRGRCIGRQDRATLEGRFIDTARGGGGRGEHHRCGRQRKPSVARPPGCELDVDQACRSRLGGWRRARSRQPAASRVRVATRGGTAEPCCERLFPSPS